MKRVFLLLLLLGASASGQVSFRDLLQTPTSDWPTYSGDLTARRYSLLKQIDSQTVARLVPQWVFHVKDARHLETTPLVVDGVMYISNSNEVYALDARTGRALWHFKDPRAKRSDVNRGVAILDGRVFFTTSDCQLVALHARTGALLWDAQLADLSLNKFYRSTAAPLAINGKVVVGVGGGDCGVRGYVDAYDAATGKRLWRHWTVPQRGEPGSETWGTALKELLGGATWMTGSYDPGQNLIFWATGHPVPAWNGEVRPGDNLYGNCMLALDAETGKLKWYYQFTPHDTHDWDAQQLPVLIDAVFQGRLRKLLVQANRNGFFYVLDRINGKMLLAEPFVKKMNWARRILPNGRPDFIEGRDPTPGGNLVCPSIVGGTNWFSPSYNPETGLFYVMSLERCDIFRSSSRPPVENECYFGTGVDRVPSEPGEFFLRAIDIQTGRIRWEIPIISQTAPNSWAGTLTTAGGLVFFGDDAGSLCAADARTGKLLWHFNTGQQIFASPITYSVAGRQHVAIANGTEIISFALFNPSR